MTTDFSQLLTPCAIVDRRKLGANVDRMRKRVRSLGVDLRPHVKTAKSVDIARMATAGFSGGITVSTLAEAEHFGRAGFRDILYAVGVVPAKLPIVARLIDSGIDLKVILDSAQTARAVADWAQRHGKRIPALIEIDSDDHRAGLEPDAPEVLQTAQILSDSTGTAFLGVMTHAGASYDCTSTEQIARVADRERDAVVHCANAIRAAGMPCEIVSVGSTPTATFVPHLEGVTEVRAGVYPFLDLFQAGLGVCRAADIALTVLTTVIGQKRGFNRLIADAGGLALSKDRATAKQAVDRKYGLVCHADTGRVIDNLVVSDVHQEHGLISTIDGAPVPFDSFPVGTRCRILPNHACMTAAAHDRYHVVDGETPVVTDVWSRISGWAPG